ncbi:angiopoietin-related protein 1-like, partial [Puntigrus tetrazona]|uniref:angiopoietin-related protein 1-like n=1 Tax=Puntigrus tetrazona TaxID=1606681 RepID=UPI001C89C0A3
VQSDIADVRELLTKQRREMDTLRMIVDVDGNMVNEMKLLRKESRNMNSRVTQLYMQLLHEIIRKRDNSLELAQLEGRILNSTAEALRLSALYRELEVRFSALATLVNNQSLLIAALEERCLQVYRNHRREPLPPPLVQVVPENIPVYVPRFSNEIQRSQGWPFSEDRSPRTAPAPTGGSLQGNVSLEGNEAVTQLIHTQNKLQLKNKSHLSNRIILKYQRLLCQDWISRTLVFL